MGTRHISDESNRNESNGNKHLEEKKVRYERLEKSWNTLYTDQYVVNPFAVFLQFFTVFYSFLRGDKFNWALPYILIVLCEWLASNTMASRINILKDDKVEMGTLIFSYWFEWFWEVDKYNHEKRPDDIE